MEKLNPNYTERRKSNPQLDEYNKNLKCQSKNGNHLVEYPSITRSNGRSKSTVVEDKHRSAKFGNGGVDSVQDHYHSKNQNYRSRSFDFPFSESADKVYIPKITVKISPNPNGPITGGDFINFGPAHYNTVEQRFYCYANCTFKNTLRRSVTTMQKVICKVSDSGHEIMNFDFNLYQYTISPGEELSINFWIYLEKNSNGYNVLKNYGDIRLDFVFETSEGNKSGWNIWGAMAQIKIQSIFVGDYQWGEMTDVQSLIENEVNAILGNHGLFISESKISSIGFPYPFTDAFKYKDIELTFQDPDPMNLSFHTAEANELRRKYSGPANFLDIFFVESFSVTDSINMPKANRIGGFSPQGGPTDKSEIQSGIVIKREAISQWQRVRSARTIAHEIGHYLGLPHINDPGFQNRNLMTRYNHLWINNTMLTRDQVETMLQHGFIEPFD